MENNYQDRIFVKNAELQVEKDSDKKAQLQRDLEVLHLRNDIQVLKNRIIQKLKNKRYD